MRGELRSGLILALALGAPSLTSCADVLGLDAPTVREGAGGGAAATTTGAGSTTTSTSTGAGTGGGGSTGSGAGGGGGSSSCETPADCDDDNPCTIESCTDAVCGHEPVVDGPLIEDPDDCRTITCAGGELSDVPNDAEDPDDAYFPCELTVCSEGAPAPEYAPVDTACGDDPLVCDGLGHCVGCDPAPPDDECGVAKACSVPTCLQTGECSPGYLPAGTPVTDDTSGDCRAPECTGDSEAPISAPDDGDVPADLACGDRGCSAGAPTTTTVTAGQPCLGQPGVCDGVSTGGANCRVCQNTTSDLLDAGCSAATPNCDGPQGGGFGNNCRECVVDTHCDTSEGGDDCLPTFVCGCNGSPDCNQSPQGQWCNLITSQCGCSAAGDCGEAGRGDQCMPDGLCGCDSQLDCDPFGWGDVCLPSGVCGCTEDDECASNDCDQIAERCL